MPDPTLDEIRNQLAEFTASLDAAMAKLGTQERTTRRLRSMFWAGVVVLAIVLLIGGLLFRESRNRVNGIQDSRVESCVSTNRAAKALAERDEDLVRIAAEFADAPQLTDDILRELDNLPTADALEPTDCEALTND